MKSELGVGFEASQWVANAYLLTLAGLILFGGSVGDTFGQRRTFILGLSGIRRPRPAKSAGPRRQPRFLEYNLGRAVPRFDELRTDRGGDGRVIARGGVRSACASAWRSVGVAREASAPSGRAAASLPRPALRCRERDDGGVVLYASLTGSLFLLPFLLIYTYGYSAAAAGAAFLPFSAIMAVGSRAAAGLALRIGAERCWRSVAW